LFMDASYSLERDTGHLWYAVRTFRTLCVQHGTQRSPQRQGNL